MYSKKSTNSRVTGFYQYLLLDKNEKFNQLIFTLIDLIQTNFKALFLRKTSKKMQPVWTAFQFLFRSYLNQFNG